MADNTSTSFNAGAEPPQTDAAPMQPAPDIDVESYAAQLIGCGLSEDQAAEFLGTLIPLIWHFVDLGFRGDICELVFAADKSDPVQSGHSATMETPSTGEKEAAAHD